MKPCPWCGNTPERCTHEFWKDDPTVMCMADDDCPLHAVPFSEIEWQKPRHYEPVTWKGKAMWDKT